MTNQTETNSTPNTALSMIQTNVNIGMDEVVNVFVSKYEDGLYVKKDDLSSKIKVVKREIETLDKTLISNTSTSQYETSVVSLGLVSKVESVKVIWATEHEKTNKINININIKDIDSKSSYGNSMTKTVVVEIAQTDVVQHKTLLDDLQRLNDDLMNVMNEIKSISRKERQIRGKISEMKLEQSGLNELLNNKDMLSLIQL